MSTKSRNSTLQLNYTRRQVDVISRVTYGLFITDFGIREWSTFITTIRDVEYFWGMQIFKNKHEKTIDIFNPILQGKYSEHEIVYKTLCVGVQIKSLAYGMY